MSNNFRKQQVTLPGLSFKDREIVYVKILTEIGRSERVDERDDNRKAANTCRVLNLRDNKQYILICPALMVSAFADLREDPVGKCYQIIAPKHKKPGKDYKEVEVWEVDAQHDYSKEPELLDQLPDVTETKK
jgi:hypothetical protein